MNEAKNPSGVTSGACERCKGSGRMAIRTTGPGMIPTVEPDPCCLCRPEASLKDLAYIETRKLSRQQVATVYGVPMYFLMEGEGASYAKSMTPDGKMKDEAGLEAARAARRRGA